jgi:H+/Cl- antiporter ClcA
MGLDLRKPIGWFFLVLGLILAVYGLVTKGDTEMYHRSLDMNINLIWGGVLIAFGLCMLLPALLGKGGAD